MMDEKAIMGRRKTAMEHGQKDGLTPAQWELIRDDIPQLINELKEALHEVEVQKEMVFEAEQGEDL